VTVPDARHFGVYPAIVTDLVDPDAQGRIQVSLPWLGASAGNPVRAWARLVSPYADDDQGLEILPEVDSEVVVAFEAGNLRRPYILGASWNGRETLPEQAERGNNLRVLKTRSGSVLEFDDTPGAAKITLRLESGRALVIDDAAQTVQVQQAGGQSMVFTPGGVELVSAGNVTIRATTVQVEAAIVNVAAGMSRFSGVVQCDTLIATSAVVSPMYTPGAGNLL
jgi:uncharacterized protein involved in type VI secretion and phage assembly